MVTPDRIAAASFGPARALSRTFERFPRDSRDGASATVAGETAAPLASWSAVPVGIDPRSLDPRAAKALPAQEIARVAEPRIPEGLVPDEVEAGDHGPVALPIRPGGPDLAPVRAVPRPPS